MKKVILIDGNNLMFRSFYGTFYSGSIMRNKEGFPTNALYGFVRMLNKIIEEEKPKYMLVAFDVGKNFREKKYPFYKEGRSETPSELVEQFPVAKTLLDGMGIKYLELEPYEADDIIGTVVKMAEEDPDFDTTIISSDQDLLQLINFETDVKLLKQKDYIRYDLKTFEKDYEIKPEAIIDLKALMGDASDNIPGVKGVGEKTALKLLREYQTLDNVYENIDNITGSLKDKLINDKDNAYISQELATIKKDIDLKINLEDLKYFGPNDSLNEIYEYLGFKSLMNNKKTNEVLNYKIIPNLEDLVLEEEVSIYLELDKENYHYANALGVAIKDKNNIYYIKELDLKKLEKHLKNKKIITYDIKKHKKFLPDLNYEHDLMIAKFLLNYVVKEDVVSIMNSFDNIDFNYLKKNKFKEEDIINSTVKKADFIYNKMTETKENLVEKQLYDLYCNLEIPLNDVLSQMENYGMKCDKTVLEDIKINLEKELNNTIFKIHELAGEEFNVASPKQLGDILFEKLNLPGGKKNKTGYKTDVEVLEKLINEHEIIEYVLKFRNLAKILSTYVSGLIPYIDEEGIIRPIFKQTLARTGRLSCVEPNLQNIPVRDPLGKTIRKAFIPQNDLFLSVDYSQIELRILAHISGDEKLIEAFNKGEDIHRRVASDIYELPEEDITDEKRETAKAVIFGIVYGISGFGLGANLKISAKVANDFIQKYYEYYPNVKKYMEDIVKDATKTGEVKTLLGRIRVIDELSSNNYMVRKMGERMALNTPMQGTSADIIKKAMVEINNSFEKRNIKSKLVLQIHDELLFDVFEDELEEITEVVKNIMTKVIELKVPLVVKTSTGKNWYEV